MASLPPSNNTNSNLTNISTTSTSSTTKSKPFISPNSIGVNLRQRGNPLLTSISIPIEYIDIEPDFIINEITCALYIRYHHENPNYIISRLKYSTKLYKLFILFLNIDSDDYDDIINIQNLCLIYNWTIIIAWSNIEIANYIKTCKIFEKKSADWIKEKITNDSGRYLDVLRSIKSVNTTDVGLLATSFPSMAGLFQASIEDLALPGFGEKKIKRVWDSFHQPFK